MSRYLICLLLFMVGANQCASRKEIAQFKKDLFYLQQRSERIQQDTNTLKKGMVTQHNDTEEIQRSLTEIIFLVNELRDETSQTKAELLTETGNLKAQSNILDSKLEDDITRLSRFIQKIESKTLARQVIDTVFIRPQSLISSEDINLTAEDLYKTAYLDFSRGNYVLALQGFQKYLVEFPETEHAADSQYWIGEIYYTQNDFLAASTEFIKVPAYFPLSHRVPNALLKTGSCFINLNDINEARMYLGQVIQEYPRAQEAGIAQSMLDELQ
ncbi:MAG: tol-pal system protein YbgF [Candidatus Marinimicrobia bacterium]|nr:tol-pal system protein YbgF [Candidatus Neomarinimicrobiota bacterium]